VTIDHQTKEDGTVTIRYRDSMEQERVQLSDVRGIVLKALHN
jgi:glycyl-tRNA synthetase